MSKKDLSADVQRDLFQASKTTLGDEDAHGLPSKAQLIRLAGDGELGIIRGWIDKGAADMLLWHLVQNLPWEQPEIKVYGKLHRIPRKQSWHGDADAVMLYSNTRFLPKAWDPQLLSIREKLEQEFKVEFNSVLANLYRNGEDGMGWHADDEAELGLDPVIASVSLGATRKFALKPRKNLEAIYAADSQRRSPVEPEKNTPRFEASDLSTRNILLGHGDLLLMRGKTQRFWQHALPKTKKVSTQRINLTYRYVVAQ